MLACLVLLSGVFDFCMLSKANKWPVRGQDNRPITWTVSGTSSSPTVLITKEIYGLLAYFEWAGLCQGHGSIKVPGNRPVPRADTPPIGHAHPTHSLHGSTSLDCT